MAFQWMRRALLALAPAALLALAACGSGTIESQFRPTRMVVFGDALSDLGNTGARYTVNDGAPLWVQGIAAGYGLGLDASASGGTNYATGNARIVQQPDAAGGSAPTIQQQIDTFLASNSLGANDLVVIQGGFADIIVQMQAFQAGTITSDQLIANVKQAGRDLATQVKRLEAAGATHVFVTGVYDMSKTPWAAAIGQQSLLSSASTTFNNAVLVALVDEGKNVLFVDQALLFNLMANNPGVYGFTDSTTVVCNSVDSGPGIGIGANQVNSKLCTTSTIASGLTYTRFMWADAVYPTTPVHTQLANYMFNLVRNRW
jgi:phospholipase/lecithinase/hemolysin